ncbi:MAG: patatin-like phospholipase family protein [Bacteroidota bacterium]
MRNFYALCCLLLLLYSNNLHSQERKKVGIVLSGGGAKGLAHVGVLKALEEHNIPIDYIVGTSMGAIVGGFYAAGYSATEIEGIVLSEDFQEWSSGKLLDKNKYEYAMEPAIAEAVAFYVDLDSNFQAIVNSNFVDDASLNFALAKQLTKPSELARFNFDSLPIPFRCIAADIFTQEAIVLKEGYLNDAVRASMTVPLFFRPVKINNKYLYDGGIYNNFPVDVMREEFQPDVVLGVNVSSKVFKEYPYGKDDELISNALKYFLLDNSDPDLLYEEDVFIEPDLKDYSATDFIYARELVDLGYDATVDLMEVIIKKTNNYIKPPFIKRERYLEDEEVLISEITVKGIKKRQQSYVKNVIKKSKEDLEIKQLSKVYYRLISNEYFRDVYPTFKKNENGKYNLNLKVNARNKVKIGLGGNLASRSISAIYAGIDYNFLSRALYTLKLNTYAGRFYTSVRGVFRAHYPSVTPIYLETTFNLNRWEYVNAEELVLKGNESAFIQRIDRYIGGNLGLTINRDANVTLGAAYIRDTDNYFNSENFSNADNLDVTRLRGALLNAKFEHNSLNRRIFPTQGKLSAISLRYFNGGEIHEPGTTSFFDEDIRINRAWMALKIKWQRFVGKKVSVGFLMESQFSNMPKFRNYRASLINAPVFEPLIDSKTLFLENFRAYNYLAGGIVQNTPILKNLNIRLEGYTFQAIRAIEQGQDQQAVFSDVLPQIRWMGAASFVFNSLIGPVSASFIHYDDPNYNFGFLFNVGYILFNPRPFD